MRNNVYYNTKHQESRTRNFSLCGGIHYDIWNDCRKEMIHILQRNKKSYWHYSAEPTKSQEHINYFFSWPFLEVFLHKLTFSHWNNKSYNAGTIDQLRLMHFISLFFQEKVRKVETSEPPSSISNYTKEGENVMSQDLTFVSLGNRPSE